MYFAGLNDWNHSLQTKISNSYLVLTWNCSVYRPSYLHYSCVTWAAWCLKSRANQSLVQHLVDPNLIENIKTRHYWTVGRVIYQWSVDSRHKETVIWKAPPLHEVIMMDQVDLPYVCSWLWHFINVSHYRDAMWQYNTVKPVYNDHLIGYFFAFWRAT